MSSSVILCVSILSVFESIRISLTQNCAITNATIRFNPDETILRGLDNPTFIIDGITTGSKFETSKWYKNGELLQQSGLYYYGGGETINEEGPCETFQFRVALLVRNKIPGVYHYKVSNEESSEGVESEGLTVTLTNGPPTNIDLRQMIDHRILVTWTAPEGATQYRVYMSDEDIEGPGRPTFVPSYVIEDSYSPGATIIVRVRAIHQPFWSLPTEPSTYTVLRVKEPEAYVVSVEVTSATLYMSQPLNTLSANQYEVTFHCKAGSKKMVFNEQQLITIEGLQSRCKYFVHAVATNTYAGLSSPSVLVTNFTTLSKGLDWRVYVTSVKVIVLTELLYALLYSLLFVLVYFRLVILALCRPRTYIKRQQNSPVYLEEESVQDDVSYRTRSRRHSSSSYKY